MSVLQLVIIQLVAFGLFIWVLKLLFYNDLSKAKERLSILNQKNLEKEKELKKKIEEAEKKHTEILEEATSKAEEIRISAKQEAGRIILIAKKTTEKEKELLIIKTNEKCKRMEEEIIVSMKKKAIRIACEIVENFLTSDAKENLHFYFINQLIDEIKNIEDGKINITGNEGKIITPLPVTSEQKIELEKIIEKKACRKILLTEEIEEKLMIGIKLNLSGVIIDGTLHNKLEKIRTQAS